MIYTLAIFCLFSFFCKIDPILGSIIQLNLRANGCHTEIISQRCPELSERGVLLRSGTALSQKRKYLLNSKTSASFND